MMIKHNVHASPSNLMLPRPQQLAWKISEVAAEQIPVESDVVDMIINRVIDNAAVALASLNRGSVKSARAMAFAHRRKNGATLFGFSKEKTFLRGMGGMGKWHGSARIRLS